MQCCSVIYIPYFICLFYSNIQFPLLDIIYILFPIFCGYIWIICNRVSLQDYSVIPSFNFFFHYNIQFPFYWIFLHYRILPINFIIGYYPISISLQISNSYVHPLHPSFSHSMHIHHLLIASTIFFFFYKNSSFQKQIRIRNYVLSQKKIKQETNQHAPIPLLKKPLDYLFNKNPRSNKIVSLFKSLA